MQDQDRTTARLDRKPKRTKVPSVYAVGNRFKVVVRNGDKQVTEYVGTLSEARKRKAALSTAVAEGEYHAEARLTLQAYFDLWRTVYKGRSRKRIRPETLNEYVRDLELHVLPTLGGRKLRTIRPMHIRKLASDLEAKGLSPGTVRLAVAPLRALFATAVEDDLLRSNPCTGVKLSQQVEQADDEDEHATKALTEEELRELLAQVPADHRLFVEFLAHCGLRISEGIAVRWGDIAWGDPPRLKVRRRIYKNQVAPPKSDYGKRTIKLSPGMARQLWELRKANRPQDDEYVFTTSNGSVLDPSNLAARVFKPAARRAGVPWAGFHSLRHTAGTIRFRNGWNAKQVQLFLGHHDPAFTLRVYVHLLPDDQPDCGWLDELTSGQTKGQTERRETEQDAETVEQAVSLA
ncbi:MAG: site-specific integrase [Actinobacteria bacterium]|nr:site-specific integrase [Actinomycetota bacterium]